MSYSQKTIFHIFPYYCVKLALDHPTRNQTPKYGFLATFWVAPSHPTNFQPNPSSLGNTLLDRSESSFLNEVRTRRGKGVAQDATIDMLCKCTYVLNEIQVLKACLRGTNGHGIMYDACIFSKYGLET